MGSREEESTRPISFYDASSPSHPLLSKPIAPIEESLIRPASEELDPTQYFQISYNHDPRSFKDLPFLILFVLSVLSTFGFGIFSIFHRNPNYSSLSSYTYDSNSTSCVDTKFTVSSSILRDYRVPGIELSSSDSFFSRDLIWTLVVTLILSVPICFSFLLLLKHYTKQIVYATLPFFVLLPIFFDVYWFVACTVSSSCSESFPLVYRIMVLVIVLLIVGIIVWIFVSNWHRIELTVRIITIASIALSRNLWLFVLLPLLSIGLLVYYVPIIVFLVFSRYNGKILPEENDDGLYSCVWKQDGWVVAYYTLAILTMLWSWATLIEVRAYVISGTIAQWYFSKEESGRKRSIRTSLRNAFGPSFGTICLSGLLIFVVRVVRGAVDSARQEGVPGIVNFVLRCSVNTLASAIDFLNKFTINFAAITGEAYCSSAKMTYELLKRNLLSAVFVETVSTRLLAGIIFVLSSVYAIAVCAILKGVSNLGVGSYYVSALAWLLLFGVLGFFVHVLDNVIDTVYVCYAIDRDRGEVVRQDVHEVYVHLPISRNHTSHFAPRSIDV